MQASLVAQNTGRSVPVGASLVPGGANFSIFSQSAASIELLFFDRVDDARPSLVIPIDPSVSRTYRYWRCFRHQLLVARRELPCVV
jgi:isoamylase